MVQQIWGVTVYNIFNSFSQKQLKYNIYFLLVFTTGEWVESRSTLYMTDACSSLTLFGVIFSVSNAVLCSYRLLDFFRAYRKGMPCPRFSVIYNIHPHFPTRKTNCCNCIEWWWIIELDDDALQEEQLFYFCVLMIGCVILYSRGFSYIQYMYVIVN